MSAGSHYMCANPDQEAQLSNEALPTLMTIREFSRWSRIGRTRLYEEIRSGSLVAIKVGRRTFIRESDARAWLDAQPLFLQLQPRAPQA